MIALEMKKKIKEMIDARHLDIAKLLIREYEALHPRDADVYLWKADISNLENKSDDAQGILVEAIGFAHQRFEAYRQLADLYRLRNAPQLAASLYRRALHYADAAHREDIGLAISLLSHEKNIETAGETPKVSIIVLANNHLEYTKQCIESIYRYTAHIEFELITVDNGSTDGTGAYFNELPNRKKVTLAADIGPVNGFNAGMMVADGKYTVCISNEFIVTTAWLDNLLACINSDDSIGFVSPGASSVSNNQQIEGPNNNDLEDVQQFAEKYNISDSSKWEERIRLLPCVLLARTEVLMRVGYFDPRFKYGEFADDDLSFRIRRAGYKLIFARDTFIHQYSSVTVGKNQINRQPLDVSRHIFRDKYGIDAWDDTSFDTHLVNAVLEQLPKRKDGEAIPALRILGINAKCGSTPLQLRNKLKEAGYTQIIVDNVTDQSKYMEDLLTVSDTAMYKPTMELIEGLEESQYDIIVIEGGLESYTPVASMLKDIHTLLHDKGLLLFKVQNGAHFLRLANWLSDQRPLIEPRVSSTYFHLRPLLSLLEEEHLPAIKLLFVQDSSHLQFTALYQKMEDLFSANEVFQSSLLSVSEMILVANRT